MFGFVYLFYFTPLYIENSPIIGVYEAKILLRKGAW